MSYLHDDIGDDGEIHTRPRERELTLSTGAILGIFLGLALLCGAFFGFGYNMGSKVRTPTTASADNTPAPIVTDFNKFKPAAGSVAIQPVPGYMSQKEADAANKAAYNAAYTAASSTTPTTVVGTAPKSPSTHESVATAVPSAATPPAPHPAPAATATPEVSPTGSFMVQVAAVSREDDADLLVSALRRKGYSVAEHTAPQDKLIHVQIGPFSTKKDAETMRQRLSTDGYNAIIK